MRNRRLSALTTLVLSVTGALPLAASAHAATIDLYVDNSNSACSNSSAAAGSQTTPFCTISAAAAVVAPGQTVHIGSGHYDEEVDLTRSGTSSAPIIFTGTPGARTQSIGFSKPHGFTLVGVHDVKLEQLELLGTQGPVLVKDSSQITLDSLLIEPSSIPTAAPNVHITGRSDTVTVSRSYITRSFADGVVVDPGIPHAVITTNQISENQGHAVLITDSPGSVVTSNALGYDCGPGVELAGSSPNSTVENNLIVESNHSPSTDNCPAGNGVDLLVSAASAVGTKADYNLVSPDAATPYVWSGQAYADVPPFQQGTGQGSHDIRSSNMGGEGSPVIDSADALAPGELDTDIDGHPRVDDPLVPNTGTGAGYYDRGPWELQDPLSATLSAAPSGVSGHPLDATVKGSITSPWSAATATLDFGDGGTPISQPALPVTHTYPGPGQYTVTMTVTDAQGTKATQTANVTIKPIGPIQAGLVLGVSFQTPMSVGADTSSTSSPWPVVKDTIDYGDGTVVDHDPHGDGHTYAAAGGYTVTHTITDDHGRTSSISKTIIVGSIYQSLASPTRILDTRTGLGATANPVGSDGVLKLQVTGRAGIPTNGKVTSVLLNLTATDATDSTHITAFPGGAVPNASNLNVTPGYDVGNAVVVPVAADGTVSLYNQLGNVDLIADVQGYYTTQPQTLALALGHLPAPVRALDTRNGIGGVNHPVGPGQSINFKVTGPDLLPGIAQVAIFNLTATDGTDSSHVTAAPHGNPPTNSSLNFGPGQTVANQVSVPINADGTVTLYNNSGSVDLIADLQGYYGPMAGFPAAITAPTRVLDTRTGLGGGNQPLGPGGTVKVKVVGVDGIPTNVGAVMVNLTATDPTDPSWLNAYASGSPNRSTSNINVTPGATVPNLALVPVGSDGCIEIYNHTGSTDVIVDLQGYVS